MAPEGRKAAEGEEGSALTPTLLWAVPGSSRLARHRLGSARGTRRPWGGDTQVGSLVPGTGKRSIPPGHFCSPGTEP